MKSNFLCSHVRKSSSLSPCHASLQDLYVPPWCGSPSEWKPDAMTGFFPCAHQSRERSPLFLLKMCVGGMRSCPCGAFTSCFGKVFLPIIRSFLPVRATLCLGCYLCYNLRRSVNCIFPRFQITVGAKVNISTLLVLLEAIHT